MTFFYDVLESGLHEVLNLIIDIAQMLFRDDSPSAGLHVEQLRHNALVITIKLGEVWAAAELDLRIKMVCIRCLSLVRTSPNDKLYVKIFDD